MLKELEVELGELKTSAGQHGKRACRLLAHAAYSRYLKLLENGRVKIDRATGDTWEKVRSELQQLHFGEFGSENGRIWQRTEQTNLQQGYFNK